MPISLHDACIPPLVHGLRVLAALLDKAAAHAGAGAEALVAARLAPDMLPLSGQVQRASDTAKFAAARLTATPAPAFADDEESLDDLQARIAKTIAFLEDVPEAGFEGAEGRSITFGPASAPRQMAGTDYLLRFVLPNFHFHLATAYGILRHAGVPVGKRDYLDPAPPAA